MVAVAVYLASFYVLVSIFSDGLASEARWKILGIALVVAAVLIGTSNGIKPPLLGLAIACLAAAADHPGLFAQTNSAGQFSLAPTTRTTHIFWLAPYRSLPPGGTVVVSADGYASKELVLNGSASPLLVSLLRVR